MNEEIECLRQHRVAILNVEGARIGLMTCPKCGAALVIDPRDPVDARKAHEAWHKQIELDG